MEGDETASSHPSEDSTVLDLPSAYDLADSFLPEHSTGISDEPCSSVDPFASPASLGHCWLSDFPKVTQLADIKNPLLNFMHYSGASSPDPEEAPARCTLSFWSRHHEKAKPGHRPNAEPFQPSEPSGNPSSWTSEQEGTEDTSIRKSLDGFYETCCQQHPGRGDPTYNEASGRLSLKIQDLANKDGKRYALCTLHMAQMVLNKDGSKIFPNHSSNACFSAPANGEVALEEGKRIPGLSDDVLQFLLRQNVTTS